MATTNETTIDTLNSLLRGELSAVETYQQAEGKFEGEPVVASLRRIRNEHQEAVTQLRQHVQMKGGEAPDSSGAWGTITAIIEGGAKAFGRTAALKALKEGEEHGVNSYESALENHELPAECRATIRDTLLPRCRQHIQGLDRLMAQQ
jgi:uncharacterized protein (TIGR02284 family)